jgi:predicted alpha-1,2-mannosidase
MIKKFSFVLFGLILVFHCSSRKEKEQQKPPADYVNPFIGTGGDGFGIGATFPGASMPFGMVKLSPDTTNRGLAPPFWHCAGYWYNDPEIRGFSHTHFSGTGVPDYGNVRFMPVIGISDAHTLESNYRSTFSHNNEFSEPGYYSVLLDKWNTLVELTATARTGFTRFTFPQTNEAYVLFDVPTSIEKNTTDDAYVELVPEKNEVNGWIQHRGPMTGSGFKIYFSGIFNKNFLSYGVWENNVLKPSQLSTEGRSMGAYFGFASDGVEPVLLKVGISYVSVENARLNRETEIAGWDFDAVRQNAKNEWNRVLGLIEVEGGTEELKTIFYTALYHTMMMPTIFTDVDGRYVGFDKAPHYADGFTYYTDMSLWDTYRNLHSLFVLILPERQRDMIISLIKMGELNGNVIPRWPAATGDSGSMVGSSADIVIADSYIKGITDFDAEKAFQLMDYAANNEPGTRGGVLDCINFKYCPADRMGGSVSLTLEYAYDDFAISQFAKALGKDAESDNYKLRLKYWRNIFDTDTKFMRAKKTDGTWVEPFDPLRFADEYVEGNAWQYTFFVPFDAEALISLFGSNDEFVSKLNEFFENSTLVYPDPDLPENFVPDLYYWHGNEPDIHSAYLFNFAGRPDLTQYWTRKIIKEKYSNDPAGLAGNDDGGTLSAWYVFSALGFYPIPATDTYIIGSPVFSRAVIHMKTGDLTIIAENAGEQNIYVRSVKLNNADITERMQFNHSEIAGGGEIKFKMADKP